MEIRSRRALRFNPRRGRFFYFGSLPLHHRSKRFDGNASCHSFKNVLLENFVDIIPGVGNIFDFFWKANQKNLWLLESHLVSPKEVNFRSKLLLCAILILVLCLIGVSGYVSFQILQSLYHWFFPVVAPGGWYVLL